MTPLERAQDYQRRGMQPVPIPLGAKSPRIKGWPDLILGEADLPRYFNGEPQNIGILLGKKSGGLADVDLDSSEAIKAARFLLPATSCVFGRPGKPKSHAVYRTETESYKKFNHPLTGETIVELRAKGGIQTVFPGSTHPSGEVVAWVEDGEPATISTETLSKDVGRVAAAALLAELWQNGIRNDLALSVAGMLARHGFSSEEATVFVGAVGSAAADEEDRAATVKDTFRKFEAGEPVTGIPRLRELIDPKIVGKVCEWLGVDARRGEERTTAGAVVEEEGSEPVPLPDLLPVPRLDAQMIPLPLRLWIVDISQRRGCPPEFPALAALCAVGAIVGTTVGVRPKKNDTFFVFPNLYCLAVGESGSQKSDGLRDGLQFAEEIQDEAWADYERQLPDIEAERYDREAELNSLEADLKAYYGGGGKKKRSDARTIDREATKARIAELKAIKDPTPERVLIEDATVEKIAVLLNENPRGVMAYHDEISSLFETFQQKDRKQDRGFYLKGWNGTGSHTVDRIVRGSMRIKNMCLSVIGGVQPSKIAPLVDEVHSGKNDDGLMQRFGSMVWPDPVREYCYIDSLPKGTEEARRIFKKLNAFDPGARGLKRLTDDAGGHYYLKFHGDAQDYFREWITELETERRGFVGFVSDLPSSQISKFRGLMPKLALIFQLIDLVAEVDNSNEISLKNAKLAADWCNFFRSHAARLYANTVSSEFTGAKRILAALRAGDVPERFTPRDIQRKCWGGLTKKDAVHSALLVLKDYGWVWSIELKTGGRPSTVYIFTNSNTTNERTELTKGTELEPVHDTHPTPEGEISEITNNRLNSDPTERAEAEAIQMEGCGLL